MHKSLVVVALSASLALSTGGCAYFNSLTPAQKVQLTAQVVNGVCVLVAAGAPVAQVDNALIHPNAGTGGSGASAAGTITKVSAIDAATCPTLNGLFATLTGTGTLTAGPAQ